MTVSTCVGEMWQKKPKQIWLQMCSILSEITDYSAWLWDKKKKKMTLDVCTILWKNRFKNCVTKWHKNVYFGNSNPSHQNKWLFN